MPPSSCTNDIFTAIANLCNLRSIEFASRLNIHQLRLASASKQTQFHPKLREGAFPVLRHLSLNTAFDDISKFFLQSFAPTNISHLYITSEYFETTESFASCLRVLVDSCRSLGFLGFDMERGASIETRISYQELAILKGLPNLKNLEFTHKHLVSLTNEELGTLVSSWASLETLHLSATDLSTTTCPTLTLACLLPLAQYCPNLRKLRLDMDATVPVVLPKVFKPFGRLEELHVGASPIEEAVSVSIFLDGLCPTEFQLKRRSRTSFWLFEEDEEDYRKNSKYQTLWYQVTHIVSLQRRLRSKEKGRSDILQREQRDL